MKFEYDPAKSAINKIKHGLAFEEAKALWEDENLLEVPVLRAGEERYLVIGAIRGKMWTGVITYRGGAVRIISVRRSRKEEVEYYES
ncbi:MULTISPECIES: BrnT family toxin [unclassified Desulfovibrio]|uniref:BrnT family toxin n=1 Tax=unclassified Desulfovibrio TaxID=2593640 RepID=UPI000F5F0F61|nr:MULTISPECIES: BrnT family toxin [unclassified Desulfovibrio]RRD70201.1 BrnT family toxin [Desulfovibrio sp. OH1209_COT-279]RRD86723.1 BrnT family toxin [Desulfovibrio sp. OH1186_COT-070]